MSAAPISLAELRTEKDAAGTITSAEIVALCDAVEAAQAMDTHIQAGRVPAGSLAAVEKWKAAETPTEDALHAALALFVPAPVDRAPGEEVGP